MVLLKVLHPLKIYQNNNGCSYSIKKYGIKVTFNGMTSLFSFIKFGSKVGGGADTQIGW
jgi:hypothetical protein